MCKFAHTYMYNKVGSVGKKSEHSHPYGAHCKESPACTSIKTTAQ